MLLTPRTQPQEVEVSYRVLLSASSKSMSTRTRFETGDELDSGERNQLCTFLILSEPQRFCSRTLPVGGRQRMGQLGQY
jgi:hypothetical protein